MELEISEEDIEKYTQFDPDLLDVNTNSLSENDDNIRVLDLDEYMMFVQRNKLYNISEMGMINDDEFIPNQRNGLTRKRHMNPIPKKNIYKDDFIKFSVMMETLYERKVFLTELNNVYPLADEAKFGSKKFVKINVSDFMSDEELSKFPIAWKLFDIRITPCQKKDMKASGVDKFIVYIY